MSLPRTKTKSAKVIALLNRQKGASVAEIIKATHWKPHSIRAFMTGLRKRGFVVTLEQHDGKGKCYRITEAPETANAAQS